jgi:3-oxoacyl-[acyl-carrier-protein] synthase-3
LVFPIAAKGEKMIGICDIAEYIPEHRINNFEKKDHFKITDEFIEGKLGVRSVSRLGPDQDTSDLCLEAYEKLRAQGLLNTDSIDAIVVCTQNPDYSLPHTSAILHGKLGLPENCAAFDISLGCSGYVYGLAVIESLMTSANMKHGLLFTADPYSKVIDEDDKNTSLLFGDAASVTYISENPVLVSGRFTFGTRGRDFEHLICRDRKLSMNGREIFNFALRTVPVDVKRVLELNKLEIENIDRFLLHQGSKYMVDYLIKRIGLPKEKTPYVIKDYGNTVSSSIPIMLKPLLLEDTVKRILISGFGVGLSWASGIIIRA